MYLENLVFDALEPRRLGEFYERALGGRRLNETDELYETRLSLPAGPDLDLCFQRVPDPPGEAPRLHLDLGGGPDQGAVVDRLLASGADHLDIGQGEVDWVVLADPEGNPFCVLDGPGDFATSGPIAALPMDCADPEVDAAFWSWLTGWSSVPGSAPQTLMHRSMLGMALEFWPESSPKPPAKNRLHLDVRLEPEDAPLRVLAELADRGGDELQPGWGDLPWTVCADPSGNEFCLLPARST